MSPDPQGGPREVGSGHVVEELGAHAPRLAMPPFQGSGGLWGCWLTPGCRPGLGLFRPWRGSGVLLGERPWASRPELISVAPGGSREFRGHDTKLLWQQRDSVMEVCLAAAMRALDLVL